MLHGVQHSVRHSVFHGTVREGYGDVVIPPIDAPLEAVNGAQLTAHLGFGHESIWKHIWLLNETASPCNPSVGPAVMTTTVGTPTFGVQGPIDSYDKGVAFTDGQAAQIATANAAVTMGTASWAILVEALTPTLPAANRIITGADGAEDILVQYMSGTGQVRCVVVDSVAGTIVSTIPNNHASATSHTYLLVGINGGNMRLASEVNLGNSISIAGIASLDLPSAWRVGANGSCPAGTISYLAIAISDGSALQNNAIADLLTNQAAAITNYRTATGR